MNYNQTLPYNYQTLPSFQTPGPQINQGMPEYKAFPFERLSSIIGQTYSLSSLENINTIPLPRGMDQQIFLVNNSEKIYARQSDNSIGVIGYRQDYVQELINNLSQAQSQLHEIFEQVAKESNTEDGKVEKTEEITNTNTDVEKRLDQMDNQIKQILALMEERNNGSTKNDKAMAAISELA